MTGSGITPGPWKLHEGQTTRARIVQADNHSLCVAEMPQVADDWGLIDEDEMEVWRANARAIAAVPEMIEALEVMEKEAGWRGTGANSAEIFYCEYCKEAHEHWGRIPHTAACPITKVATALAKARGE